MIFDPKIDPKTAQDGPKTDPRGTWKPSYLMLIFVFDFDPFWGPFWAPLGTHLGLQIGPKSIQQIIKNNLVPTCPQETAPRGPKTATRGPKIAPRGPQTLPRGLKITPRGPKIVPRGSNIAPRCSQDPPSGPKISKTKSLNDWPALSVLKMWPQKSILFVDRLSMPFWLHVVQVWEPFVSNPLSI